MRFFSRLSLGSTPRAGLAWNTLRSRYRPGVMRCFLPQVRLHLFFIDTGQKGLRPTLSVAPGGKVVSKLARLRGLEEQAQRAHLRGEVDEPEALVLPVRVLHLERSGECGED